MGVTSIARARALARVLAVILLCIVPVGMAHADDLSRAIRATVNQAGTDADLKHFYEQRRFRPAWTAATATEAVDAMARAETEGLDPADYRVAPSPQQAKGRARGRALAAWDIAFTQTFLRYARHVRTGRLPPAAVYLDIELSPEPFDAPAELNAALKGEALAAFIADMPPPRPEYRALRDALARYRAMAWDPLPLRAGQALASLPPETREKLRARLAAEDPTTSSETSKAGLDQALRRFQRRLGLEADGRLGAGTVAALNRPAVDMVLKIEANMERWRWLPRRADERYVEVNIPDASLKVVERQKTILMSPLVLGQRDWPTPILATTAQAVVLNPPWHVPPDIVTEEILPQLRRNASYLAKHNMVLIDGPATDPHGVKVKWSQVSTESFPYRIEQKPGPASGLGALLFDMPNTFDVYLHDTPAKALFAHADRFLSHGCVRVQNIAALARWAVSGDMQQALPDAPGAETVRVPLTTPLPVYMLYWTAFEGPDRTIAFRPDIYALDARLIAKLQGLETGPASRRTALMGGTGSPAP